MLVSNILSFARYKLFSWHKYGHGIHSPLVYRLVRECFCAKISDSIFAEEKEARKLLKMNKAVIKANGYGAGSRSLAYSRSVSQINKACSVPHKYGKLLYKLCCWVAADNVLELGTSVGMGAMYLSKREGTKLTTVDACSSAQAVASEVLGFYGRDAVFVNGLFDDKLPAIEASGLKFGLIYIDGDHTAESTLANFSRAAKLCRKGGVIVIDDIRWSGGMLQAWEEICKHKDSRACIDLWKMGIVFTDKELSREVFTIRY
jgi:predicted O-methyltransferase YrrM